MPDNPFTNLIQGNAAIAAGVGNPFTPLKEAAQPLQEEPPAVRPPTPGLGATSFPPPGGPRSGGMEPPPGVPTLEERQAKERASANLSIQQALGPNKYDPSTADDPILFQAAIARRYDQGGYRDAQSFLEKKYPNGSVLQVPDGFGGTTTVYSKGPDADGLHEYHPIGGGSALIGQEANLKNLGMTVGSVAGAPGGPVASIVAGAGGAALGSLADTATEKAQSYAQDVTTSQAFGRAAGAGAEAAIGGAVPALAARALHFNLGMLARISPDASSLVDNLNKEGLWPLGIGQLSENPAVRAAYKQASATTVIAERLTYNQKQSLADAIQKRIDESGLTGVSDDALNMLSTIHKSNMLQAVSTGGDVTDKSSLNNFVQDALQHYKIESGQAAQKAVSDAADLARSENASFSLLPMQAAAAQIKRGVIGKAGQVPYSDLGTSPVPAGSPVQLAGPTKDIQPYVDLLSKLDPKVQNFTYAGKTDDAFSQITSIRADLYNLMTSSADPTTRQQAWQLFNASHDVIAGAEATPATKIAMTNALASQSDRLETLGYFGRMINSNEPGNVATKLVKPGYFNTVKMLMNTLSDDQATIFKQGFKADLISNPGSIESRINAFANDKPTLDMVLTPEEQSRLIVYGRAMTKMQSSPSVQLANSQASNAERAIELAGKGQGAELDRLVADAGGYNSPTAEAIRGGIYMNVLKEAKTTDTLGRMTINTDAIKSATQRVLNDADTRYKNVLSSDDIERLQTWNRYASVVGQSGSDMAGALQRGAILSELRKPLNWIREPERTALNLYSLVNNEAWAKIFSNPVSARMLDTMPLSADGLGAATIKRLTGALIVSQRDVNEPGRTKAPSITP